MKRDVSVHFSSRKNDWETPDDLWGRLNHIYKFDLDAAASEGNARCKKYYDVRADGLAQPWAGRRVWCNPPYGKAIGQWIHKATQEAERCPFIVMLVPSRTDTAWWHYGIKTARVQFLRGRLRFKGASSCAPFPSALFYWNC